MKKLIVLLSTLLVLTACSSNADLIYKEDKALYKIGGKTVNESDYYQLFVSNDKGISIYSHMLDHINENSTTTTTFAKEIEETIELEIQKLVESFGDDLDTVIKTAGFDSLDIFIETQLKPSVALQFEIDDYVKNNIDTIANDFKLKDVSIFATDDKEFANTIIAELEENVEPSKILIEKKAQLKEQLISKSFESGSDVVDKHLKSSTKPGISTVLFDKESNLNYIIVIHETDFKTNLEAIVQVLIEAEGFTDIYTTKQFKEANFKIHDDRIKDLLNTLKPGIAK